MAYNIDRFDTIEAVRVDDDSRYEWAADTGMPPEGMKSYLLGFVRGDSMVIQWFPTEDGAKETLDRIVALDFDNMDSWIPCSERLPERDGSYIVTTAHGSVTFRFYSPTVGWAHMNESEPVAWIDRKYTAWEGGAANDE